MRSSQKARNLMKMNSVKDLMKMSDEEIRKFEQDTNSRVKFKYKNGKKTAVTIQQNS